MKKTLIFFIIVFYSISNSYAFGFVQVGFANASFDLFSLSGNCANGYTVQNTTNGGVQCIPVLSSYTEIDPIFTSQNNTMVSSFTCPSGTFLQNGSRSTAQCAPAGIGSGNASTGYCPSGQVVQNSTTTGVQCLPTTAGSGNITGAFKSSIGYLSVNTGVGTLESINATYSSGMIDWNVNRGAGIGSYMYLYGNNSNFQDSGIFMESGNGANTRGSGLAIRDTIGGDGWFMGRLYSSGRFGLTYMANMPAYAVGQNYSHYNWFYSWLCAEGSLRCGVGMHGLTTPAVEWDVNGSIGIRNTPAGGTNYLYFLNAQGSGNATIGVTGNNLRIGDAIGGSGDLGVEIYSNNTFLSYFSPQLDMGLGIATPTSKLHIDDGTATAVDTKYTAGSTTGQTATDGFDIGIASNGDGEIRQYENRGIYIYTNNTNKWDFEATGYTRFKPVINGTVLQITTTNGGLQGLYMMLNANATTSIANRVTLQSSGVTSGSIALASGNADRVIMHANGTVQMLAYSGTGNAYACFNALGEIYRSNVACI